MAHFLHMMQGWAGNFKLAETFKFQGESNLLPSAQKGQLSCPQSGFGNYRGVVSWNKGSKIYIESSLPLLTLIQQRTKDSMAQHPIYPPSLQFICGISKCWGTQRGCNWESAELSSIVPRLGSRGMENPVIWMTGCTERHPGGYFTFGQTELDLTY